MLSLLGSLACSDAVSGFDIEDDPDDLADFDRKSDGDVCADWSGGELSGDDLLVLVNKDEEAQLAKAWAPSDTVPIPPSLMMPGRVGQLRFGVLRAAEEMFAAAAADGLSLGIRSAYRSFRTQCITFNFKVETHGLEHAKRFSAEPGRSQHQLGTPIDISSARLGWSLEQDMGDEIEGQWLAANANRFGFALSYPEDAESITGYAFEPWHYRYIGREAATELAGSSLILEQYLAVCETTGSAFACPSEPLPAAEPNHAWIGGACETRDDCYALGVDAVCITDGYVGGYCSRACFVTCPDLPGRNATTFCVAVETDGLCHSQCDTDLYGATGCRSGYVCELASRPGATRSAEVCLPDLDG